MNKQALATILQEGSRLLSELIRSYPRQQREGQERKPISQVHGQVRTQGHSNEGLTTDETVRYQRREIGKELLLQEKHLQQRCKIGGKACDCCGKHLVAIEALAQETLGMTSDPALDDLIQWVRTIGPKTTESASSSGQHEDEYPQMAIRARELRKAIMGTDSASAMLAKEAIDANEGSAPREPEET